VTVGGVAASGVTVVSADTLRATVPAREGVTADTAVAVVVETAEGRSATAATGYTYLAVIDPTFTVIGATDPSLDYSGVGTGDVSDRSAGEVTFTVAFTGATGVATAGQAISWAVTNNGAQSVFLLGQPVTEIAAGASRTVSVATGSDGRSAIVLDSEGGKTAGVTSVSVTASATANNSDGVSRSLSASFSATWDVAVVAELASFQGAVVPGEGVRLQWTVASQTNNLGWEVYRSQDNVTFEQVGDLVAGDGTVDELKVYSFTDTNLPQAEVLYYYLSQVDLDGTTSRTQVIPVAPSGRTAEQALPTANALLQNYPNPFNPETTIAYDLTQSVTVNLTVYDAGGQVVRALIDGQTVGAGHYRAVWNGRDSAGAKVASGVYFYVLQAGDFTSVKKMLLAK